MKFNKVKCSEVSPLTATVIKLHEFLSIMLQTPQAILFLCFSFYFKSVMIICVQIAFSTNLSMKT